MTTKEFFKEIEQIISFNGITGIISQEEYKVFKKRLIKEKRK